MICATPIWRCQPPWESEVNWFFSLSQMKTIFFLISFTLFIPQYLLHQAFYSLSGAYCDKKKHSCSHILFMCFQVVWRIQPYWFLLRSSDHFFPHERAILRWPNVWVCFQHNKALNFSEAPQPFSFIWLSIRLADILLLYILRFPFT